MWSRYILFFLSSCLFIQVYAQDLDLLDEEEEVQYTYATFKTNRIINGHSIEMVRKREMDVKFSHRFGFINTGAYELFGLDRATMRMGVDYGLTDNFNIGLGRSTTRKTFDGYLKYRVLRQQQGKGNMPVSVVAMTHASAHSLKPPPGAEVPTFAERLHYTTQVLIARKFNKRFSLQLTPTLTHINQVDSARFSNDIWSLGIGFRQKLTARTSVNFEYYHVLAGTLASTQQNALSIGFDIETGGHVFQLFATNAAAPYEKGFITDTQADWRNGGIRFGFNIARIFSF